MSVQQITIPPSHNGERLDKALALLLPDTGIRLRRRHIEQGDVTLNGKMAAKGTSVQTGDTIALRPQKCGEKTASQELSNAFASPASSQVTIVRRTSAFAAIFKPAGLHTAAIAGKSSPSLEVLLPALFHSQSNYSHGKNRRPDRQPVSTSDSGPAAPLSSKSGGTLGGTVGATPDSTVGNTAGTTVDNSVENTAGITSGSGSNSGVGHTAAEAPDRSIPALVNRLDMLTSGIVMAAFSAEHAHRFRELEDSGSVEKLYLTLLEGEIYSPFGIDAVLDTDNRKITRVLDTPSPDPLRHTGVLPLHRLLFNGRACTLALASIHKGARHQIRAHCAHAGYPIVGDPLYGRAAAIDLSDTHDNDKQNSGENSGVNILLNACKDDNATSSSVDNPNDGPNNSDNVRNNHSGTQSRIMYLHHYHIEMPNFVATCPPLWPQWEQWSKHLSRSALG